MRPIGIDLFAGAGGLSLGFEQAGMDVVAAVDIDPVHSATHQYNFPNTKVICRDIGKLSGDKILSEGGLSSGEIDVVFGGAPCQGFSMIGKRALDDPRNCLVGEFTRLVLELRPKYFVFENVHGLTVGKHRNFLQEFINEFKKKGYDIKEPYRVLNAVDFGVPQDRRRLFLIGARREFELPDYPGPLFVRPSRNAKIDLDGSRIGPTVWDAIGDLPEADDYPELRHRDWTRAKFGPPSEYAKYLRGIVELKRDYVYPREWNRDILTSSLRTEHTPESKLRFKKAKFGETEPVSRFHKLDPNGVCNTLRAGTGSDRGAYTSPRPIHPYTPRCITVREAARLHSFPDWFRFHVTKWHGFRQIGNSVPPLLAKAIASQIVAVLGAKPKKPGKSLKMGDPSLLSLNMSQAAELYEVPSDVTGRRLRVAVNA
ncbi:MAG: DNA cytosine methyltransferase [Nitrospinae bacterium]|nr:DNA cytosine methyltransferase [Nitrospinota bacterium]